MDESELPDEPGVFDEPGLFDSPGVPGSWFDELMAGWELAGDGDRDDEQDGWPAGLPAGLRAEVLARRPLPRLSARPACRVVRVRRGKTSGKTSALPDGGAMPLPARRHMAPGLLDWLEGPWPAMLPFGSNQTFRVEDYTDDGKYMIRAELPGIDPQQDVEVTVDSGMLTIRAERREESKQERHSEFKYGSLTRSLSLPEGTDPDKITATYDKGILEVTVPVPKQPARASRQIAVQRSS